MGSNDIFKLIFISFTSSFLFLLIYLSIYLSRSKLFSNKVENILLLFETPRTCFFQHRSRFYNYSLIVLIFLSVFFVCFDVSASACLFLLSILHSNTHPPYPTRPGILAYSFFTSLLNDIML